MVLHVRRYHSLLAKVARAIGGFVSSEELITYYEHAYLNFTISIPVKNFPEIGHSLPKKLLLFLVYVYSGGFVEGKGYISALYNTTKMTELAANDSIEVVIVSIGYRLNW